MQGDKQLNSRLGRVLVNKGYVSEAQLDKALKLQAADGGRLGEILVGQGWVSQSQLHQALKRQSVLRRVGAVAALISTPFYAATSFAAGLSHSPIVPVKRGDAASEMLPALPSGLIAMSDGEMMDVNAQASAPIPSVWFNNMGFDGVAAGQHNKYNKDEEEQEQTEEQVAYELMDTVTTLAGFGPLSSFIEADLSIDGLRYIGDGPRMEILEEGAIRFYTGMDIDRVNIENIRVKGSERPATFGSIYMSDITIDPGSNFTIRANGNRW